jgi:hypothetical protein
VFGLSDGVVIQDNSTHLAKDFFSLCFKRVSRFPGMLFVTVPAHVARKRLDSRIIMHDSHEYHL